MPLTGCVFFTQRLTLLERPFQSMATLERWGACLLCEFWKNLLPPWQEATIFSMPQFLSLSGSCAFEFAVVLLEFLGVGEHQAFLLILVLRVQSWNWPWKAHTTRHVHSHLSCTPAFYVFCHICQVSQQRGAPDSLTSTLHPPHLQSSPRPARAHSMPAQGYVLDAMFDLNMTVLCLTLTFDLSAPGPSSSLFSSSLVLPRMC